MALGKADRIELHIPPQADINHEQVQFVTTTGTELYANYSQNVFNLHIPSARSRDGYELIARLQHADSSYTTIAMLHVAAYELQTRSLVIVPMQEKNHPPAEEIARELTSIYAPYGVQWQVRVDDAFTDQSWDEGKQGLQTQGSEFFSIYTSEMKNLHSVYESQRDVDSRSAYIFWFAQKSESSELLLGDMPLESRYGYVFSKALDQQAYHTIAHELAHGVFSLRHTFSKDYAIAQGSTRNLMDYPTTKTTNATELKKYQWDALHDPKKLIAPWMQNEEEGRMEGIDYKCLPTSITKQNPIEHYYTNTPGKTIKLTEDFIPIAFVGMNDNFGDKKGGVAVIKRVSDGVLFFPARNYQRFPDYYSQLNDGNLNTSDNLYKYLENGDESQALLVEIERDCSYRIIKNNSIIAEDNFKYDCNCIQNERFNENSHILKTISGDLSAEEYNNLVEKLTKRLNTQSSQSEYFSVGEDFKTERDEELQIADLNDRFKVFNTETGNQIFVDVIYTHAKLSNNQLLTLAEDVYKNSNLAHNNNAIYIVLPVWNETIITSHLKSIDKNKFSKSFYSKNETYNNVSDLLGYKGISGNIIDVVEDIYSLIPKPHIIASYAITYSGEIIRFKLQKTANVSGNNFIYDFRLAVDNLLHTYIQQVKIIESSQPNIPPKGYGASRNTTEYHNQAILRAMDAQERIHNLRINNDNIEYKIIKHGLFESALTPNSEGISEVAQQFVEWYVRHEFGMSASSPADTYFKIGKNEVVYQETLNTIDKIGLLLMPLGLDIITDGIGAIYAGYYYDIETASYYGAGIVVAGVSGAVFRQLATRSKKISRVSGEFKIVDNVEFKQVFKATDDFWNKIPSKYRKQVQEAFETGSTQLKYADEDLILYRHISQDGAEKSFWYARLIQSPQNARKFYALPSVNNADWVVKVKVKKGTPFIEGKVASQVGNEGFGAYATGGGNQLYFLHDYFDNIQVVEKFINPIK